MPKLVIDNLLIEKSDKDIKTGIKYKFKDGLNIICGENEAGKSSLMKFIKDGLLKLKNNDAGRIFFKLENDSAIEKLRAEINGKKSAKDTRLIIYDENNTNISASFYEKHIKPNYIENAFIINLDDLMSLQITDKISLADVIKDPTGNKLNASLNTFRENIKKIYGDNNSLTKDTKNLLNEINTLSNNINGLSQQENRYNDTINDLKSIKEQLNFVEKQENYLKISNELNVLKQDYESENTELQTLNTSFNERLYLEREKYSKLIEKFIVYKNNINLLGKNEEKIQDINNRITNNFQRLSKEFGLNYSEDVVLKFNVNYSVSQTIKETLEKINLLKQELVNNKTLEKNINEENADIKYEIKTLQDRLDGGSDTAVIKSLYKFIDDGIKQYNSILNELSEKETPDKVNNKTITSLNIMYILMLMCSFAGCIFYFYKKELIGGSIFGFVALTIILAIFMLNGSKSFDCEKEKLIQYKNSIFEELKNKVLDYTKEDDKNYNHISKIDIVRQDLIVKIKDADNILEQIQKNTNNYEKNQNKLNVIYTENEKINKKIRDLYDEITDLIQSENPDTEINIEKYLEIIDIIIPLKNDINDKNKLIEESKELQNFNDSVKKEVMDFINVNAVNINISEIFENTMESLKEFYNDNNALQHKIDIIKSSVNQKTEKIEQLEDEINKLGNIKDSLIPDIYAEKERLYEARRQAEIRKHEVETYEGLNGLRLEKSVKLAKYRAIIKELIENKIILLIGENTKKNFDKKLPDLINAEKYLSLLTGNKYSKINLDLEEIGNEGGTIIKKWSELSRGTKEQLYLALRLGYASNYSKDINTCSDNGRANLPIIIDDAFVNFDSERFNNAVKCLNEFSKTNQVLFFTCHTNVIKDKVRLLNIVENVNFIDI